MPRSRQWQKWLCNNKEILMMFWTVQCQGSSRIERISDSFGRVGIWLKEFYKLVTINAKRK